MRNTRRFPARRLLAGMLAAGLLALSACAEEETVVYKREVLPKNDGKPATLTLAAGELLSRENWRGVLEDVIRKYQGDYPDTQIILSDETYAGRQAAGLAPPDIFVTQQGQEDLLDLSPYLDAWENEGTLTSAAQLVMHHRGGDGLYAVPIDFTQKLLFYRRDWFTVYNKGKGWERSAKVDTWNNLVESISKLGDQGKVALDLEPVELFNSILWSAIGVGRLADRADAYYLHLREEYSAFSHKRAQPALELFETVEKASLPREEDPVKAFIDGKAGMLITNADSLETIAAALPEDAWRVVGMPEGASKTVVVPCEWIAWGVSARTEEPEKAAHFLSYLTNADCNTYMAKACGLIPIYTEAVYMEPTLLEDPRGEEIALLSDSTYRYASQPYTLKEGYLEENRVARDLERFLGGELTGEELLAGLDQYHMDIFNEYRDREGPLPWDTATDKSKPEESETEEDPEE